MSEDPGRLMQESEAANSLIVQENGRAFKESDWHSVAPERDSGVCQWFDLVDRFERNARGLSRARSQSMGPLRSVQEIRASWRLTFSSLKGSANY